MATRFIGDRRPANAVEATIGKAKLPEVQRLRRIIMDPHKVVRVHFRDFKNCFFIFAVDEDRLSRQVVGPLVPREWFEDLEITDYDFDGNCRPWSFTDNGDDSLCQVVIRGVIVGDK